MIVNDNLPWLRMLFSIRSIGMENSWSRILGATLFAAIVTGVQIEFGVQKYGLTPTPFMILGVAIGIFLGFRNNSAYDRFWEGRVLWGRLINAMRSLSRQTVMLIQPPESESAIRPDLLRLLIAYTHAFRHHLRESNPSPELALYLPPELLATCLTRRNVPLAVLDEVSRRITHAWQQGWIESIHLPVLEASLTEITAVQGGCERIKNTPIPLTYIILCHRLVAFFCFFLPLGLVESVGYFTPLVVFLVSHALFGLDVIGEQIEDPFEYEPHDLPLDAMSRTIEIDLLQAAGEKNLPEPLLPRDGILM